MKTFVFSKTLKIEAILERIPSSHLELVHIEDEEKLLEHGSEKCLLIIDIDTVKDHGFVLASKMATDPNKRAVIIGVTTLDVNSVGAKFDFFFNRYEDISTHFEEIRCRYEEI